MDPAVMNWPTPQSVKDVQRFLGFANFYRRSIRNISAVATSIIVLTKRVASLRFHWNVKAEKAFSELKRRFLLAAHPHYAQSLPHLHSGG